jgi:hypothetical protein
VLLTITPALWLWLVHATYVPNLEGRRASWLVSVIVDSSVYMPRVLVLLLYGLLLRFPYDPHPSEGRDLLSLAAAGTSLNPTVRRIGMNLLILFLFIPLWLTLTGLAGWVAAQMTGIYTNGLFEGPGKIARVLFFWIGSGGPVLAIGLLHQGALYVLLRFSPQAWSRHTRRIVVILSVLPVLVLPVLLLALLAGRVRMPELEARYPAWMNFAITYGTDCLPWIITSVLYGMTMSFPFDLEQDNTQSMT